MKKLSDLTELQFNSLKNIGLLWEFFPDSPEFYENIKKEFDPFELEEPIICANCGKRNDDCYC